MTETEQDIRSRILAFAAHVGRSTASDAETIARRRDWIDAEGRPTTDGLALVAALGEQAQTRTVFRGNF
ncbi:hypothetical protein P6F26_03110 [Roseibacterium sp. SDUM158017]|uniref:hypothetical protein n=1 Tax=Roseicyclus salinarum TaxID=3036773 RepID=UPI002414FDA0|nr:hypothetical protein [Roseibacterium sp. SDUM158017]MDG4647422.1 hypothetical protein [Roseibacterium sp. SDUM158017]